jgi:pyrimidine-nucleoside phosphorylase
MISGRGLGHTGGTLDKLEAIPGFRVDLDRARYQEVLRHQGLVMIGPTAQIAPADKFLYALRDATATVESIPLIAASILSKKLAEGIDGLVLDVKTGNGALLDRLADARQLAKTMCTIGRSMGKRVIALITRMDQPLGRAVGNAVEVAESVACLRGRGPSDLMELSIELAAEMVVLGQRASTLEEARAFCRRLVADGSALARFRGMVEAQGGHPGIIDDPSLLPAARAQVDLPAPQTGVVHRLAARPIGQATMLLGAGRARVDSAIDPAVGVLLHKKVGDPVQEGEPLGTVLVNDDARLDEVSALILGAYTIGDEPFPVPPLLLDRLSALEGTEPPGPGHV